MVLWKIGEYLMRREGKRYDCDVFGEDVEFFGIT